MITNMLPSEVTHSSLDLFQRQSLLVAFDGGFEQRIGPVYSSNGPTLEFKVLGDRHNFIDLQNIYLQLSCTIKQQNSQDLRYHATNKGDSDEPKFVNNILHSLFSECDVFANGAKISSANGLYAHKSYLETELCHGSDAKKTWLTCQGYSYEPTPQTLDSAALTAREGETRSSAVINLIGRLSVDFFTCDKLLLPDVSLRIKLVRSHNDFVIISDDAGKHYTVEIGNVNLIVRKMVVNENAFTSIERALLKTPAMYHYTEVIPKTFIIPNGQNSWKHEDIFMREPIRRMAIAMNTNAAFGISNRGNPYNYQKFDLRSITLNRNGVVIAGTPLNTEHNGHVYFNSLGALAFGKSSHGIPQAEFSNHFVMVFDLTSTLEASHEFIHPELTNSSISIDLSFGTNLPLPVEVFIIGEKASTIFIDSSRNISKKVLLNG